MAGFLPKKKYGSNVLPLAHQGFPALAIRFFPPSSFSPAASNAPHDFGVWRFFVQVKPQVFCGTVGRVVFQWLIWLILAIYG